MTTYSKFNIIYRLQKWMDSVPGQTFLNYAYSWGASIVILGTLFKLTHMDGADFFLFLGMGTEVLVFFLSAFDRPFDKTADGMELDTHVHAGECGQLPGYGHPDEHEFQPEAPDQDLFELVEETHRAPARGKRGRALRTFVCIVQP